MRLKAEPGCGEIAWVGLATRKLDREVQRLCSITAHGRIGTRVFDTVLGIKYTDSIIFE